jgi:hypothetical protein
MSRLRCDIRRLWFHLPRSILTPMERRSTTGLEVCLECGQDFVSLARCTGAGSGTWWLLLRCGGCATWHETFARDEAVAALQEAITRGVHAVAESVEAFSEALELDLIGPDDF